MLATQNPVDLDYKALSNMGTWFLGRLQTERDQMRVLDGLQGATASMDRPFDRKAIETTLAGLTSRTFLMNNVHDRAPVLFRTRWVMSYLRGPMTRAEIARLTPGRGASGNDAPGSEGPGRAAAKEPLPASKPVARPVLPPQIKQCFFVRTRGCPKGSRVVLRPSLLATATLHFVDARRDVDIWRKDVHLTPVGDAADPWVDCATLGGPPDLQDEPDEDVAYAKLPASASDPKSYARWLKQLEAHVYRSSRVMRWQCKELKLYGEPGADEGTFRAQVSQVIRERRDEAIEKVKSSYEVKTERLQEKLRKAQQRLEKEEAQYKESKRSVWIRIGETILGAVLGRRRLSSGTLGKAQTAARGVGRQRKEKLDVEQAEENLAELKEELEALDAAFQADLQEAADKWVAEAFEVKDAQLKPRKSDIAVEQVRLAWIPWIVDADGMAEAAWTA